MSPKHTDNSFHVILDKHLDISLDQIPNTVSKVKEANKPVRDS